jgi:signal transduction histidine kinase
MRALPAGLFALTGLLAVISVVLSAGREAVYDTVFYPLNAVVLALAGALITSHRRGNAIGWVLTGMGIEAAVVEVTEGYGYHAGFPGAVLVTWTSAWASLVGAGTTSIVLLLFPTGRVLSRRWRGVVRASVAGTVLTAVGTGFGHSSDGSFTSGSNPYALPGPWMGLIYAAGQALWALTLLAAIASLILRYRRCGSVERQQLKWVAYVVGLFAVVGPLAILFYYDSVAVRIAIAVVVTTLPVAICVAILRYRLYDIDVIITRTLVYSMLSLLLAAAYLATALILGAALGNHHSTWGTAGATLAAAAAFRPLRTRIQDGVDRRFRRARYDALTRIDVFLEDLRAGRAAPETLEQILRDVLQRNDLQLLYLLPDALTAFDAAGAQISLDPDDGRIHTRVARAGVPLAVVVHSAVPPSLSGATQPHQASDLTQEILAHAGLAIEIARLRAEVKHQLAEVEASRARIVAAGYEERRRLERDLHDGAQQRLVSVGLALRHAQHELGTSPVSQDIEAAVTQLTGAIADLRELANGVRPAYLDHGLDFALRELAARTPLPVRVHASGQRFSSDVEATAYFVACEGLTNAVKHSAATGIDLHAKHFDGHLVVTIRDDGIGGAQPRQGSGLRGLSDRVMAQGGRIRVDSEHGQGTTLTAELPCAS